MANVLIDENTMTAIGDAIRNKTGKDELMLPADMPQEIEGIEAADKLKKIIAEIIDGNVINIDLLDLDFDSIRRYAFYNCTNLERITLPEGLTSIGSYAFYNCENLAITELPESITSIGDYAFNGCTNIALTSLPEGIKEINGNTFYGCTNLALTVLPKNIKSIYSNAFCRCEGLKTITFMGKLSSITSTAFNYCTNLTTINVPWAEGRVPGAPWGAINATINYNYIDTEEV